MPRTANPAIRTALIDAAARLLADEGPASLTLRRLTSEVGTSTMAVYTHFGGMDELVRAVRVDGFARLADHLGSVPRTDDPVADLAALGVAYFLNAVTNPNLYRVMFGHFADDESDVGLETFVTLSDGVARCIEARRFRRADATEVATQVWAMSHGVVTLQIAGFLGPAEALQTFSELGGNLMRALGDKPATLDASWAVVAQRAAEDSRLQTFLTAPAG